MLALSAYVVDSSDPLTQSPTNVTQFWGWLGFSRAPSSSVAPRVIRTVLPMNDRIYEPNEQISQQVATV